MSLNKDSLKSRIIAELNTLGMNTTNEHSFANVLAEGIANAVVDEIQANADVTITGGSSSGTHPGAIS